MKMIGAVALGAVALMAATAATAQAQNPQVPDSTLFSRAPAAPPASLQAQSQPRPLFTIGGLEVHLWAPVESPYNANMNRNQAANPLWEAGQ
ncbi:MAG TPA: hypothetical protein VGC09_06960 [Rhodopila sp.]